MSARLAVAARLGVAARLAVALVIAGAGACAHEPGPQDVAHAYLAALAHGDLPAAHALSIAPVRTGTPAAALAGLGAPPAEDEAWSLTVDGHLRLTVVREHGLWRVDDEALRARQISDPRGACAAFLTAAIDGNAVRARLFLPDAARARYADDAVLHAYLVELRPRLVRARDALADAGRRAAVVESDHAEIPYDDRRAIRLVREGGGWRVVDVE